MDQDDISYGLLALRIGNAGLVIIFASSSTRLRTSPDRDSFGAFSTFMVARSVQILGFPSTIFLVSGWFAQHYRGMAFLSQNNREQPPSGFAEAHACYPKMVPASGSCGSHPQTGVA